MKNWYWGTIQLIMKKKKVVLLITNGIGCLISASGYFPKPSLFFKSSSSKHRVTGQFQISNSKDGSHYRKNMPKSYCLFVWLHSMWDPDFWPGIKLMLPSLEAWSLLFFIFFLFLIALGLCYCTQAFSSGLLCCFSCCGAQALGAWASVVVTWGLQSVGFSCPVACGIFPEQESNQCPLHWQADSYPLYHQESPSIIVNQKNLKLKISRFFT